MAVPRKTIALVAGATLLTLVALAFSAPPDATIFGQFVPLPSKLIYHVAPGYRVLSRFVILVMLGLCILAAVGLATLGSRMRRPATRRSALVIATAVVALDIGGYPPTTEADLRTPSTYAQLRSLPPGIVAEYPIVPATDDGVQTELYFQSEHGKPVLGGYPEQSPAEAWALAVRDLYNRETPGRLAALGVRYIVVPPAAPPVTFPIRGFRVLRDDRDGILAEVVARPTASFRIEGAEDLSVAAPDFRWLTKSRATIYMRAGCRRCAGSVTFNATSFGQPRDVTFTGPGLATPITVKVPNGAEKTFRVPVRFSRSTLLHLRIEPGPQSNAGSGESVARELSIYLAGLRFAPASAHR